MFQNIRSKVRNFTINLILGAMNNNLYLISLSHPPRETPDSRPIQTAPCMHSWGSPQEWPEWGMRMRRQQGSRKMDMHPSHASDRLAPATASWTAVRQCHSLWPTTTFTCYYYTYCFLFLQYACLCIPDSMHAPWLAYVFYTMYIIVFIIIFSIFN